MGGMARRGVMGGGGKRSVEHLLPRSFVTFFHQFLSPFSWVGAVRGEVGGVRVGLYILYPGGAQLPVIISWGWPSTIRL